MARYGIIDLFAGPGGLGEGFASVAGASGDPVFDIHLSAEMNPSAHATLRLRAFLRALGGRLPQEYIDFHAGRAPEPDWESIDPDAWAQASREAHCIELGTEHARSVVDSAIDEAISHWSDKTVLIGGPPCQAYSLVGRARNKANADYVARNDKRHFLFKEYLRVLEKLQPAVFVMENVKGLLSSKVDDAGIFDMLLEDLKRVGGGNGLYELFPLSADGDNGLLPVFWEPPDFVVEAERHGVPQTRHRVILLGVRRDLVSHVPAHPILATESSRVPAKALLDGLPRLRSGLTRHGDDAETWRRVVLEQMLVCEKATERSNELIDLAEPISAFRSDLASAPLLERSSRQRAGVGNDCPPGLANWILDERLEGTANHHARSHMDDDLGRYAFAAVFGDVRGHSPKASDFPGELSPDHANWNTGKFADRFRVQVADLPATTVTSHISKDGHYFIHPDPTQCRSLTVREAARLQTFPDNYMFLGNRTSQYQQVGNAVPPFLARQIAEVVRTILASSEQQRTSDTEAAA